MNKGNWSRKRLILEYIKTAKSDEDLADTIISLYEGFIKADVDKYIVMKYENEKIEKDVGYRFKLTKLQKDNKNLVETNIKMNKKIKRQAKEIEKKKEEIKILNESLKFARNKNQELHDELNKKAFY